MSFCRVDGGLITFTCDECAEEFDSTESDFIPALDEAKDKGWRAEKVGREWRHYCGCERKGDFS